ncbi:MAG: thioredoxin family protein [Longimicrobiales bacterium]|nr:thioredoxin family protein [Longimicrobiales bacterium]
MNNIEERFRRAPDFSAYLTGVEANRELWESLYRRARVPEDLLEATRALTGTYHLLALSEDWCGDAFNVLPVVARWVEQAPGLELRVLGRDDNPDLMDAHLTGGRSRSIPVVIVYDADFNEVGWWGPRPGPLQAWVLEAGLALPKDDRYREIRRWYARDRGRTAVAEILAVIPEAKVPAAAAPSAVPS